MLKGRGWSLCMLLSEFLSFGLSSFCCLSVPSNKLHKGEDTLTGSLGGSGLDRAELSKIYFFSASIFLWFWHRFWMTFLMIFQCCLHHFFDTYFSTVFSHFSYLIFSCEPSPTRILLQPASVKTISPCSENLVFS